MLTQSRLKEILDYDPDTGVFKWRRSNLPKIRSGDTAGVIRGDGQVAIKLYKRWRQAHRLAYLYMTGEIPGNIYHIDKDKSNNRWSNLRVSVKNIDPSSVNFAEKLKNLPKKPVEVIPNRFDGLVATTLVLLVVFLVGLGLAVHHILQVASIFE
jgi:hypothetical protein